MIEQDMPNAREYTMTGTGNTFSFNLRPDTEQQQSGRQTNVYVVHKATGAYTSFTVVNNLTRLTRNTLSNSTKG